MNDEEIGNGDLTYPISLITIDEVYLAGGDSNVSNNGYYLYTGNNYWTLSPLDFGDAGALVCGESAGGRAYLGSLSYSRGVRPVINLKAGSLTKGSGTALDPYQV